MAGRFLHPTPQGVYLCDYRQGEAVMVQSPQRPRCSNCHFHVTNPRTFEPDCMFGGGKLPVTPDDSPCHRWRTDQKAH